MLASQIRNALDYGADLYFSHRLLHQHHAHRPLPLTDGTLARGCRVRLHGPVHLLILTFSIGADQPIHSFIAFELVPWLGKCLPFLTVLSSYEAH